ncbi:hypothetical protein N7456_006978 [Penicillium angulare]|uniref:Uncharacterized protein n=1 Tax=Penicillium angulare TaxID=116970 RepID=A0A9W9FIM9_9EURO|nr:hypothetical protein N7456_006978 [Penicillium angulare]
MKIPAWMFADYSKIEFPASQQENYHKHIDNILTWWQETGWLINIYFNNFDKYLSILSFVDPDILADRLREKYALALYLDAKFKATGTLYAPGSSRVTPVVSKPRFYRAVMSRCLNSKMLQYAKLSEALESSDALFKNIRRSWSDSSNRTLKESLEVLEVFDFIHNFLLLGTLDSPATLEGWAVAIRDDRNLIYSLEDSLLSNWMLLLPHLQPYLTPFDILANFRKDELSNKSLHFFSSLLAISENYKEPPKMSDIEDSISCVLNKEYDVASELWDVYRRHDHGWRKGVRGRVFGEDLSPKKVADEIKNFENHSPNWWKFLSEAEEDDQSRDFRVAVPQYYLKQVFDTTEDDEARQSFFTIAEKDLRTIRRMYPSTS